MNNECDACSSKNVITVPYRMHRNWPEDRSNDYMNLCDLCASTPMGNAYEYPEQYEDERNILKTICYIGNAIIKAIKENKNG